MMARKDKDRQAEYMREYRQRPEVMAKRKEANRAFRKTPEGRASRAAERVRASDRKRAFVGVDGEGCQDADGRDNYWLLRVGELSVEASEGRPNLATAECIDALFRAKRPGAILVGYSIGYDVGHWLRDLTPGDRHLARTCETGVWVKIGGEDHRIRVIPRKKLEVIAKRDGRWQRVVVFDAWSFFQSSFLAAVERWSVGTDQQRIVVKAGKDRRGEFYVCKDFAREYNGVEVRLLEALMRKVDRQFREHVGVRLTHWHGPGAAAKAVMSRQGIKLHISSWRDQMERSPDLREVTARAYYGGRFQLCQGGLHEGVMSYDIRSAYPHQIRFLPPLHGGWWDRCPEYRASAEWAVWRVCWSLPDGHPGCAFPPFPWRTSNGAIHYPPYGQSWVYADELRAAIEVYGAECFRVLGGWVYYPPPGLSPFSGWVERLYDDRREASASGEGNTLKLVLNSLYGALAQRPVDGKEASYACQFWAGLVTSGTRASILRAAGQSFESVISTAVDGINSARALDLPIGPQMGQWTVRSMDELEIYQPLAYRATVDGDTIAKRHSGVAIQAGDWDRFRDEWLRASVRGSVVVPLGSRYISPELAYRTGEEPYRWVEQAADVKLRPSTGFPDWGSLGGQIVRWHTWSRRTDYRRLSHAYSPLLQVPRLFSEARQAYEAAVDCSREQWR
jgi:hypothetical protein